MTVELNKIPALTPIISLGFHVQRGMTTGMPFAYCHLGLRLINLVNYCRFVYISVLA